MVVHHSAIFSKVFSMPIFKIASKLVYFAHVPKCAGSAVEKYIGTRFGEIAFYNNDFMALPEAERWSKTSPQHIDCASLSKLFPPKFFDASFALVRHPVDRLLSVFHFQREREKLIAPDIEFSSWLDSLPERQGAFSFTLDNHVRPMSDLVPKDAKVFHVEHDIDALIPWFDELEGSKNGARTITPSNVRGKERGAKVKPSAEDVLRIARLYKTDFDRFGYDPHSKTPKSEPPKLNDDFLSLRDREKVLNVNFVHRMATRIKHRITR
jgi:Sulfotransferase family